MKDASPRPIDLESSQVQFLEDAAKQFGLPDMGKAVRCLVNYAREPRQARRDLRRDPLHGLLTWRAA